MLQKIKTLTGFVFGLLPVLATAAEGPAVAVSPKAAVTVALPAEIQTLFNRHCVECHGAETAEAELRFDNTATLGLDGQLALFNAAQEQLYFGLMPPEGCQATNRSGSHRADRLARP